MSNMMIVCIPGVVCWSNCAKIFDKLHFWGVNHQVHEQFIQAESLNEATQSQWKIGTPYASKSIPNTMGK